MGAANIVEGPVNRIGMLARLLPVLALGLVAPAVPADAGLLTTGQDSYAYRFIDREEAGGPTMDFEDIAVTGAQAIGSGVDDSGVGVSVTITIS